MLFLDEPTTGLDPEVRAEMWERIAGLVADGTTVLLTTHYLEEADWLADRLLIVDRGRVVVEGSPADLRAQLEGDTISVVLHDAAGDAAGVRSALSTIEGVRDPMVEGTRVSVRSAAGAEAVPAVLAALDRAGVAVMSVTVSRPSLDDVYLPRGARLQRGLGRGARPPRRARGPGHGHGRVRHESVPRVPADRLTHLFSRPQAVVHPVLVIGAAGAVVTLDGRAVAVMGFAVAAGAIVEIDVVGDPARVGRLAGAVLDGALPGA